jgi:putative Mn2+ efflux pump MntP
VIALLLVAVSLGLPNFAAATGIGVTGAGARTRLRVGLIFGVFEAGMPVLGLFLGHALASTLGHAARWAGAGLLIATGAYGLLQALRAGPATAAGPPGGNLLLTRLLVTGLALSIDNPRGRVRAGHLPCQPGAGRRRHRRGERGDVAGRPGAGRQNRAAGRVAR